MANQAPASQENQQADPYTVIRNLQSACAELEAQNNWLRTRAAEQACRADRATEVAQALAERLKVLEGTPAPSAEAPPAAREFTPAPDAPTRKRGGKKPALPN